MTGSHKAVRALVAAIVTTLLAALMHLGAGGDISVFGVAIVFILVLWMAMILAGRRLGYIALGAILGLGQLLTHVSMGWFTTPSPAGGEPQQAMGHQHMHTGALDLGPATAHGTNLTASTDAAMVLAHVGAVIATAVLLKRGDDLILTILQLALGPVTTAAQVLIAATGALSEVPTRPAHGQCLLPGAVTAAVTGANYRRGPPAHV